MPLAPSVQTMMWAVGLRGAVAYGLAMNLPASGSVSGTGIPAVESATLVIVLATTLVFGGATGGQAGLQYKSCVPAFLLHRLCVLSIAKGSEIHSPGSGRHFDS